MNIIGQIDPSAFACSPRMHHGDTALEFPSSVSSRVRHLNALKACNWRAASAPPAPVFHFEHGKAYSTNGNIVDAEGWSICTDFIQVLTREKLTWKWGNTVGYGRYLIEYDSSGNYTEYFGSNNVNGQRTVTLQKAETTQIRFSVMTALLDDCFVYSETRGIYLWKGANVQ